MTIFLSNKLTEIYIDWPMNCSPVDIWLPDSWVKWSEFYYHFMDACILQAALHKSRSIYIQYFLIEPKHSGKQLSLKKMISSEDVFFLFLHFWLHYKSRTRWVREASILLTQLCLGSGLFAAAIFPCFCISHPQCIYWAKYHSFVI